RPRPGGLGRLHAAVQPGRHGKPGDPDPRQFRRVRPARGPGYQPVERLLRMDKGWGMKEGPDFFHPPALSSPAGKSPPFTPPRRVINPLATLMRGGRNAD